MLSHSLLNFHDFFAFYLANNSQESSFTKLFRKTERNRPFGLRYEPTYHARVADESEKIH